MEVIALQTKRTWTLGLIVDCPFGKALDTCPAKEIRKLPLEKRVELVKAMDEDQLQEIIMYHKQCSKARL